jgi:Flagellar motor switch protein
MNATAERQDQIDTPGRPAGLSLLVDRMTGKLGTAAEVEAAGRRFQAAIGPAFEAALEKVTGLEIAVRPGEIRGGRRRELLAEMSAGSAYCTGTIRDWSLDISYLCDASVVIALVECLLGNADTESMSIMRRPLSDIELDMSLVIFEQFNDALKGAVTSDPKVRAGVSKPESVVPEAQDDPIGDFHAAAIGFDLEFGPLSAPLYLFLDQATLLRTKSLNQAEVKRGASAETSEWSERLSQRVVRSEVQLEARIALEPLKFDEISRLQPGDVLAFADVGETRVTLGAAGRDLYTCALGRSGQRYMVRIEAPVVVDDTWRNDLA